MNKTAVILVSIALLASIVFWARIKLSKSRSRKALDFTNKFYRTFFFTLNEMGINPSTEDGKSSMAFSFTIRTGLFCTEEEFFNKMKELLSKQSIEISIDGVKTSLPYSAILEQINCKGDVELETRKATMEYIKNINSSKKIKS